MFLHGLGSFFARFSVLFLLAVYMLLICFLLMLRASNHNALRACTLDVSHFFVGNASSLHQIALPVHMSSQVYVEALEGSFWLPFCFFSQVFFDVCSDRFLIDF